MAAAIEHAAPELTVGGADPVAVRLNQWLAQHGLDHITAMRGGASAPTIAFFRDHDLGFRIRRLRLLARRLAEEWDDLDAEAPEAREEVRAVVYQSLALYFDREASGALGGDFGAIARDFDHDPGAVLSAIARRRQLPATDLVVDGLLVQALAKMPRELKRRVLLTYLGFPFYDTVTLPLLRGEGSTEFEPAKVDRISPEDCNTIRPDGAHSVLRGTEFYNFGAFFSRAYRENDYLWGRLHGAERMIDLIGSTMPKGMELDPADLTRSKIEAFHAVLDEEEHRLKADPKLIGGLRAELSGTA